jgi:Na+-transporting methylmalonyl-CoA/oxaloacetate decarboxylase gamma subunit
MTALTVRGKQWLKVLGIALILVVLFILWGVVRAGSRKSKREQATEGLDEAITALRSEISAANAEAAIAITAARNKDRKLKEDLAEAVKIDDGKQRRKRLIALREGMHR